MSRKIAFLWWEGEVQWEDAGQPFSKDWKSKDYAMYTELGEENNLEIICGDYTWYENGSMKKAWRWNGEEWEKVEDVSLDGVYDLFRHDKEKFELKKEMESEVGVINDPGLADLCQDKWETYRRFGKFQPETRKATDENIEEMLNEYGEVVLKPRYGSGGHGIRKLEYSEDMPEGIDPEEMLVQKFVDPGKEEQLGIEGPHDLRLLYIDGELFLSVIRTPSEGFRSNVDQGGSKRYVDLEDVPGEIREISSDIKEGLDEFSPAIYSVDFMFSKEGPIIMELNSQPGIFCHRETSEREREYPAVKKVVEVLDRVF